MTLRNEKRYGTNVGKTIWRSHHIKGKGELIEKEYNVKKDKHDTKKNIN